MKLFLGIVLFTIARAERLGSPKTELTGTLQQTSLEEEQVNRHLQVVATYPGSNGKPTSAYPLKVCQGDCDKDSDCQGNLKCFQRSGFQSVPGCSGLSSKWKDIDFCYDPSNGNPAPTGPTPTVPAPSPSPPTGNGFRLRLYWEKGYYWQESYSEKKYCMECDGSSCGNGDKMRIQNCGSNNTILQHFARNGDETNLKDSRTNFCMSLESNVIYMRTCSSSDKRQRFKGSFDASKFEINPVSNSSGCLTQQHHPKPGEEVRLYSCSTARGDQTSYWNKY